MGGFGVGLYSALGAANNDSKFFALTVLMRSIFAGFFFTQWGWEYSSAVIMYESAVAILAALAVIS